MKKILTISSIILLLMTSYLLVNSCKKRTEIKIPPADAPYLVILGTSQDGGYPQAGCTKECCQIAWENPDLRRLVSCIAIVDPIDNKQWIIDATPDFREQMQRLGNISGRFGSKSISGIFLTHAHAGHYTGLIHLGREIMGSERVPVFAMPRMMNFLRQNGPWDQLVKLENIELVAMKSDSVIQLNERLSVIPIPVPHRDEYTETVGIIIKSDHTKAVFIPDIDKWDMWDRDICSLVQEVDIAFLDATFYKNGEIPGRDMRDIPHPFMEESFSTFSRLSDEDKSKIHFIHFNHTNPVIREGSEAAKEVVRKGYAIAQEGQIVIL
jgi:pyrroloquinoline quinone biosynthesis protein B